MSMPEVLNEVGGESAEFAPSSRIALGLSVSQKITPCPSALSYRDRWEDLRAQQSPDGSFFW